MVILLCPLCSQPCFNNLESLRFSLVRAATQNISCPICFEISAGLDKFTIHLFGHVISENITGSTDLKTSCEPPENFNGSLSLTEKLDKKLENPMKGSITKTSKEVRNLETRNLEASAIDLDDLGFLYSLGNNSRADHLKKGLNQPRKEFNSEEIANEKEDSMQLSEYMCDLLNKKLPILNFAGESHTEAEETEDKKINRLKTSSFEGTDAVQIPYQSSYEKGLEENKTENAICGTPAMPASSSLSDEQFFKDLILPRYHCHLCQKSFKMKGSLLVHYKVAHIGPNNPEPSSSAMGVQEGTDERIFCCSICNKSFKKDQHLTQHIKTHEGKQWKCETCNKCFTTKYFLKKHQRLHTGEMPYSCPMCNKTFTFQQSYRKHLMYHSDEKPHQCLECGRTFKELSTLHNHQRIHSGEKPFTCETCGKCFRQRVSYMVHQRIHTGVLPYQCIVCKKKFRYKVSQRSHKCSSQPPGEVVRTQSELVQDFFCNRRINLAEASLNIE